MVATKIPELAHSNVAAAAPAQAKQDGGKHKRCHKGGKHNKTRKHRKTSNTMSSFTKTLMGSSMSRMMGVAGGSRKRRKSYKGGFMGAIVQQAMVPLSLLGLQHYGTKRRKR